MDVFRLSVSRLFAFTKEGKEILKDISLEFLSNRTYAVMGPNGSGKSTLAHVLMGSSEYAAKGKIMLNQRNILHVPPEKRAKLGLFLAYQSPLAIPGVSVVQLLRAAYQEQHKKQRVKKKTIQNPVLGASWDAEDVTLEQFMHTIRSHAQTLSIDKGLLERGIHEGFSGGERKKIELLQALVLAPTFAIFDEIDTGLDIDALEIVAKAIVTLKRQGTGVIMITHYKRLLSYVPVDTVYVFSKGTVLTRGGKKMIETIEQKGYKGLTNV